LKDVGLFHVKNAHVSTFSGGMKRRMSLAISAIGNPKIIILDEPTSNLMIFLDLNILKLEWTQKHEDKFGK